VRVHDVGQSPCDVADTVGSNPGQSEEHVWCFEGADGDSTWPAGPAGAGRSHWSRYDPPVPAASRWHVTQAHGGSSTGTYNAWAGCDSIGTNPACTDVTFWIFQDGYGNDWNYALALDMSSLDASAGGTVEFDLRYDTECNYDYLYLEYLSTATGSWESVRDSLNAPAIFNSVSGNLDSSHGGSGRSCGGDYFGHGDQDAFADPVYGNSIWLEDARFVVPAQTGGIQLRWRAFSDGAWSDADGRGDTDGLAAIDNVTVTLVAGTTVTDDFETGDFSGPVVSGPAPARGTVTWQPGALLGNAYDGWHLTFDPNYKNKGNLCLFSNDWMWSAKPDVGPIPENGFDFFLVTPSIDVSGWTGGVIEFADFHSTPDDRDDALRHATRTWSAGAGWAPWNDFDAVFWDIGGFWELNRTFDFSDRLGAGVDSLQFAWNLLDFSQPGDFTWGNHVSVQALVDNVSIGSYERGSPVLTARSIDFFRDTFSRSDPAHTPFLGNAVEGQWPTRAFLAEDSLNVAVEADHGIQAANVTLSWRVGTGTPPVFGSWATKALHFAVPDPFSSSDEGLYRTTIGNDADEDWSGSPGDGRIWEAGATVEYVLRAVDDLANETNVARFFRVLPFDRTSPAQGSATILLVNDQPLGRVLLDFEQSAGFDPGGGTGNGGFSAPAYVAPVEFAEDALALAGFVWDRYDVLGSGSSVEAEPRGTPLPGAGVGGFLDGGGAPHYDAIVWVAGAVATVSDDVVRDELETYLDAGGNLLLLGDSAAFQLTNISGAAPFLAEYLGATMVVGDESTDDRVLEVQGVSGTPFDGIGLGLYGECPQYRGFDRLGLASPAGATATVELAYANGAPADDGRAALIVTRRTGGGVAAVAGFDGTGLLSREAARCFLSTVLGADLGITVPIPGGYCSPGTPVPLSPNPPGFTVSAAAPSPFRDETRVHLVLPGRRNVTVTVHDVLGRRIATLADGSRPSGVHAIRWDGSTDQGGQAPAGVYFVRIVAGPDQVTRKVVRLN